MNWPTPHRIQEHREKTASRLWRTFDAVVTITAEKKNNNKKRTENNNPVYFEFEGINVNANVTRDWSRDNLKKGNHEEKKANPPPFLPQSIYRGRRTGRYQQYSLVQVVRGSSFLSRSWEQPGNTRIPPAPAYLINVKTTGYSGEWDNKWISAYCT